MGRRASDGQSVKALVLASTVIVMGNFYKLSGVIGIAFQSVTTAAGETSEVALGMDLAEYETSQIDVADAFARGNDVYFDPATLLFNSVAEGAAGPVGSERFGVVTRAKNADNSVRIKRTHLD